MRDMQAAFSSLPTPKMTPAVAYRRLVRNDVERVSLDAFAHRVAATGIVPYPPGIPMLMPGESAGPADGPFVGYLRALRDWDRHFPGFGHETHGVEMEEGDTTCIPQAIECGGGDVHGVRQSRRDVFQRGGLFHEAHAGLTVRGPAAMMFGLFMVGAALQAVAMRHESMAVTYAIVLGLEAVTASLLSVWLLHERTSAMRIGGIALVVAGIVLLKIGES